MRTMHHLATMTLVGGLMLAGIATADEPTTYGSALTVETATSIADIVADPAKFDGKTVKVEGRISDVCPMKGCWMTLTDKEAEVRIKVDDDVIVFPKEAKGRMAVAEGVVRVKELERDSWISWQSHLAEEKGETFDASTVGEGPFLSVQIEGHGAEIAGT